MDFFVKIIYKEKKLFGTATLPPVSKWRMECERQQIEQRIPNTFSS